jgi:multiple sugar transport system ATP-binding protein
MIYVTHDQIEALTLADRIAVMKDQRIQQLASPADIYRRPANIFVAGFVGSPRMNFIEGRLEGEGNAPVFVTNGHRLALGGYAFSTRPETGQAVTLGIRPEHLTVADGGDWDGFTVDIVEPMGADNLLWCGDGKLSLGVRTPGERPVSKGTAVRLAVPADNVSLFATATGERV